MATRYTDADLDAVNSQIEHMDPGPERNRLIRESDKIARALNAQEANDATAAEHAQEDARAEAAQRKAHIDSQRRVYQQKEKAATARHAQEHARIQSREADRASQLAHAREKARVDMEHKREMAQLAREKKIEDAKLNKKLKRQSSRRSAHDVLYGQHLAVKEGKEVRLIDAAITIGVASGSVLWTASRNHNTGSDILWGLFWTGLGGIMAVQGNGELRYGGFGVAAANSSYLALRLTGGITSSAL